MVCRLGTEETELGLGWGRNGRGGVRRWEERTRGQTCLGACLAEGIGEVRELSDGHNDELHYQQKERVSPAGRTPRSKSCSFKLTSNFVRPLANLFCTYAMNTAVAYLASDAHQPARNVTKGGTLTRVVFGRAGYAVLAPAR